jgi:hypothetical protein
MELVKQAGIVVGGLFTACGIAWLCHLVALTIADALVEAASVGILLPIELTKTLVGA